jgi:glycosidase
MPVVIESDDPQPLTVDPNSLPGFTAGTIEALPTASNGATANVAMEQADPKSLLSFYRQLIQLHHDNAAVRNGTQSFLDTEGTLAWIRKAPAGSKSPASVVVRCRPSGAGAGNLAVKIIRPLVGTDADAVFIGEAR